jgi:hypothetical protein
MMTDMRRLAHCLDLTLSLERAVARRFPIRRGNVFRNSKRVGIQWDYQDGRPCFTLVWPKDGVDLIEIHPTCPAEMRAGIATFARATGLPWDDARDEAVVKPSDQDESLIEAAIRVFQQHAQDTGTVAQEPDASRCTVEYTDDGRAVVTLRNVNGVLDTSTVQVAARTPIEP